MQFFFTIQILGARVGRALQALGHQRLSLGRDNHTNTSHHKHIMSLLPLMGSMYAYTGSHRHNTACHVRFRREPQVLRGNKNVTPSPAGPPAPAVVPHHLL